MGPTQYQIRKLTSPITAETTMAARAHCKKKSTRGEVKSRQKIKSFNNCIICTRGINSNNGVMNNKAEQMIMPMTNPDKPVFAPLSLLTADLEKEPIKHI